MKLFSFPLAIIISLLTKLLFYGQNSIVVNAINAWINSQDLEISLSYLSPNKIKNIL